MRRLALLSFSLVACSGGAVEECEDPNASRADGGGGDCACNDGFVQRNGVCSEEDQRQHGGSGSSWTFLVYMVADNNLEEAGLGDLIEMMSVGSGADLDIVVQVDRAADFTNAGVGNLGDWQSAKRLHVQSGSFDEVEDLGEVNMGAPGVLSDFIEWGVTTYPADRYALVMWDHGGAWPGFGGDDSTGDQDRLTLAELAASIGDGLDAAGLAELDLIGFDACLMATLETALTLRPFGEYLVASEELEPGHGWDYERLSLLANSPTSGPLTLGQELVDGFQEQAQVAGTLGDITLSVIDLYEVNDLGAAVSALAAALDNGVATLAPATGTARAATAEFGRNPDPAAATHMIDIGHFGAQLQAEQPSLQGLVDAVDDALARVVVENMTGPASTNATGLSIYFPPQRDLYDPAYASLAVVAAWNDFLAAYHGLENLGGIAFTNPGGIADFAVDGDGDFLVGGQLDAGSIADVVGATLLYGYPAAGDLVLLGDNTAALFDDGSVAGLWDTTILWLDQGGTQEFGYLSVTVEDDYIVATVPFEYVVPGASSGDLVMLTIVVDASGNVVQETYYLLSDNGPGELYAEAGSDLFPLVLVIDAAGTTEWARTTVTPFAAELGVNLSFAALPAGADYSLRLLAEDFAGNVAFVGYDGTM